MPTLELHGRAGREFRLVPDALWIIGNNGRVDMKGDGNRYIVIDMADNFEEPNWEVSRDDKRSDREAVTREWLSSILR